MTRRHCTTAGTVPTLQSSLPLRLFVSLFRPRTIVTNVYNAAKVAVAVVVAVAMAMVAAVVVALVELY